MNRQIASQTPQQKSTATPSVGGVLQRKYDFGPHASVDGGEEAYSKRLGLQTKLKVNEPGDIYEQEADRIANQVMAMPANSKVGGFSRSIQRLSGEPTGQNNQVPKSMDQALASPGRPLEPALRADMEHRFGYDFSRVRVHTGADAEQSARDVNAHAYTAGHDIVFGAGRFAPGTQEWRHLIAYELTHVVQQSWADCSHLCQSDEIRSLGPIDCVTTSQVQTQALSIGNPATNSVAHDATGVGLAPGGQRQVWLGVQPHFTGEWEDVHQDGNDKSAFTKVDDTFHNALKMEAAGGSHLSPIGRAFFEPRFGVSFQHIRIHDGLRAAALSHELSARAFTHGDHIYFAAGQHNLASTDGRRLMAHELAHTIQQRALGANAMRLIVPRLTEILSPTPDMRIQCWDDVHINNRQLASFTDRRGAEGRMALLRAQNPNMEYRIIERGGNFVIQSRARETQAGSPAPRTSAEREVAERHEGISRVGQSLTENDRLQIVGTPTPVEQPVAGSVRGRRFVLHATGTAAPSISTHRETGRRSTGHGAGAWVPREGAFTITHRPLFGPRRPTATRWERGEDILSPGGRTDLARRVWRATDPDFREAMLDEMLRDQGSSPREEQEERRAAIQQLGGSGDVMSAGLWAVEDICAEVIAIVGEACENFQASALEDVAFSGQDVDLCDACVELQNLTEARRERASETVNVEIAQASGTPELPEFTRSQYRNVMQLYLHAALEAGTFPEITTHFVVDRGIGTHDDPRCFDLGWLYHLIAEALTHDRRSLYGARPIYGTRAPANVYWDAHVCGGETPRN